MATHLRETTSAQGAADTCAAIAGALDSDDNTKHLAPLWDSLTAKGDLLANERRKLERALLRARARLAIADATWDPEIGAFARDVLDQSGGKRDQLPNTRFFNAVTASEAQDFGVEREIKQGEGWLDELDRNPTEPLAVKWKPRLTKVNGALSTAATNRTNALRAVALQGTSETIYIEEINLELDKLEGDLLKLFPGQPKRVAAFLEATRPRRKRSGDDGSEPPAGGGT